MNPETLLDAQWLTPISFRNVLRRESEERNKHQKPSKAQVTSHHLEHSLQNQILPFTLECTSVTCGVWTTDALETVFAPQVEWNTNATATFGPRIMKLTMHSGMRIDFRYGSVLEITTEDSIPPAITFTMLEAPRFFERIDADPVAELMSRLNIKAQTTRTPPDRRRGPDRKRLPYLNEQHKKVAGSCLVYRMSLPPYQLTKFGDLLDIGGLMASFAKIRGMPTVLHQSPRICRSLEPYATGFEKLQGILSSISGQLPFVLKFQIQRLAHDGFLSPFRILSLLPNFEKLSVS